VLRNGVWNEEDAAVLVHGDIISIKLGDIVLADARLMDEDPLKIDQSIQAMYLEYYLRFYMGRSGHFRKKLNLPLVLILKALKLPKIV
ncbi:hypothetical protein SOVF_175380 isoform A, partial [Spinacia oleracea]